LQIAKTTQIKMVPKFFPRFCTAAVAGLLLLAGCNFMGPSEASLNADRTVTISLETSDRTMRANVDDAFADFEATALRSEPARARPIYERALLARKSAALLYSAIDSAKTILIGESGGLDTKTGWIASPGNRTISRKIMIGGGRAAAIRKMIGETRTTMLSVLINREADGLQLPLDAQDATAGGNWEETNFGDGVPLAAALMVLTKIQADLRSAEYEVVRRILGEVNTAAIIDDLFEPVAIPKSTCVAVGEQYEAEIFMSSTSARGNPEVRVDGRKVAVVNGKGIYTAAATAAGQKRYNAVLRFRLSDGNIKEYHLPEQTYMVVAQK
jgi:gliding motility-associated protein GldM